ncbi:MAG: single-stranded DNA-binding protein [bacterium]|nr:single-stranded DNA-binding protein [bacterium]
MNKVILVGRITKDPELRNIQSGSSVVNFTIAVNRPVAQNADQNANNADFINCVIWNKQAENLAKYVKQGSLIGVEGRIQTRSYESNGQTRYITEVLCDNVQFLETKKDGNGIQKNADQNGNSTEEDQYASKINSVDDNDLPF